MSSKTRAILRKELSVAGDRRDWDECNRLEKALVWDADAELEEIRSAATAAMDRAEAAIHKIEAAENTKPVVEVVDRRWVARKHVVFEDIGGDRPPQRTV